MLKLTVEALNLLKNSFPSKGLSPSQNPWYLVAAVGLSASNRPEAVAQVFKFAIQDVPEHEERLAIARKIRDGLFKSGLISGYPKVINALIKMKDDTPADLLDTKIQRDTNLSLADYEKMGEAMFARVYGAAAHETQALLDSAYPDMGYFSKTIGYGFTYGLSRYTTDLEFSYIMLASLIAIDSPLQIMWHLDGALRNGASIEQVRAVRGMAIEVARLAGVLSGDDIPDL